VVLEILDAAGRPVGDPVDELDPHPYRCLLPAGIYTINARLRAPQPGLHDAVGPAGWFPPPEHTIVRSVGA